MNYLFHSSRRFTAFFSLLLFIIITFSNVLPVNATIDYPAEAQARKSLPIQTNDIENWPDGPAIGAASAILMEANTGTILYAKNIHDQLYPASTTKILTCLIASEKSNMNDIVTYSKDAVFSVKRDESNMGMDAGEAITVEQTLYGILVGSANEAANAIAEHISGSMEAFAGLMNEKAKELGCKNSNFVTTNGCFDENHYTSAYDLALIAQAFYQNELLAKMSNTYAYEIPPTSTQPDDIWVHSKHQLLDQKKYSYEGFLGGKTGFTSEARQTLVSCAQRDGMKLICVIMKEESPNQFSDTVELFDYGFQNFKMLNIAENETNYTVGDHYFFNSDSDIFGSSKPILSLNTNNNVVVPNTVEFADLTSKLEYNTESKNSVATITYFYKDELVGTTTVDLAVEEKFVFDFENQTSESEPVSIETSAEKTDNIIFLNIKKVILCIVGVAALLIMVIFVRAFVSNYHFAKKRSKRLRHKKRKQIRTRFDDFDF